MFDPGTVLRYLSPALQRIRLFFAILSIRARPVRPLSEAAEGAANFSIVQAGSLGEAIDLVRRIPNVFPNGEAEVEIRKLMDVEDFGDAFTPGPEIAKVKCGGSEPFR